MAGWKRDQSRLQLQGSVAPSLSSSSSSFFTLPPPHPTPSFSLHLHLIYLSLPNHPLSNSYPPSFLPARCLMNHVTGPRAPHLVLAQPLRLQLHLSNSPSQPQLGVFFFSFFFFLFSPFYQTLSLSTLLLAAHPSLHSPLPSAGLLCCLQSLRRCTHHPSQCTNSQGEDSVGS